MKVCPQCQSTDVPATAKQCPYCLYRFEEIKKVEPPKQTLKYAVNNSSGSAGSSNASQGNINSNNKKVEQNNPQSMGKVASAPATNSNVSKNGKKADKKRGNGRNGIPKWIIIVILIFLIMYIRSCFIKGNEPVEALPAVVEEETPTPRIEIEETVTYIEEYMLPNSSSEYLTEGDLEGLSKEELRIARNEIYARHGRRFNDSGLQSYFDSQSWYEGTISPEDFTESYAAEVFNQYELANKDFIAKYESMQ